MRIKQEYRLGVGISAMLLIFVMISIVTLGVLSFLSARADKALTDKSVLMVQAYYAASADAQHRLFTLDNDLQAITSEQELEDYAKANALTYENNTLRFTVDVGGGRVLLVAVQLDERFQMRKISQYSMENQTDWTPALPEFPIF
ncbi:MAG TPA: hypothetical protein PKU80_02250 [Candidatus Limiplasma sp.]|nr:hypothetical protein [Candidatus Limiplasma sp.]HRX07644.1 hypothetical protein [Candidatus Limiplasma sp.]